MSTSSTTIEATTQISEELNQRGGYVIYHSRLVGRDGPYHLVNAAVGQERLTGQLIILFLYSVFVPISFLLFVWMMRLLRNGGCVSRREAGELIGHCRRLTRAFNLFRSSSASAADIISANNNHNIESRSWGGISSSSSTSAAIPTIIAAAEQRDKTAASTDIHIQSSADENKRSKKASQFVSIDLLTKR